VVQIYEKIKVADSQALKEKYEEELKKEIKKLQRCRDQIKVRCGARAAGPRVVRST
jgi:CCR4-NOT transcriptional regulation complex NOT5 subunit